MAFTGISLMALLGVVVLVAVIIVLVVVINKGRDRE